MKRIKNIFLILIIMFLFISIKSNVFASEIKLNVEETKERFINLKVNSDTKLDKIYIYKKNSGGRYNIFKLINAHNQKDVDCRISIDKLSSTGDTDIKVIAIQEGNKSVEKTTQIPKTNLKRTPIPSISQSSKVIRTPKTSDKDGMTNVKPTPSNTPKTKTPTLKTPTSKTPTPTPKTPSPSQKTPNPTSPSPSPTTPSKEKDKENPTPSTEEEARNKIAEVAEKEYKNNHHTNGKKYYQKLFNKKKTHSSGGWCSEFVAWCGNECGYIEAGIFPKCATSQQAIDFFKKHPGKFVKSKSYKPDKGDILITKSGGSLHSALVVVVSGSKVTYIAGGGSSVRKRTIKIGNGSIYG